MAAFRWVYVACRDEAEARKLARLALEKRLAACANIFPISSLFWWKGKIEHARETALVLKTRAVLVRQLFALLKKAHSYEVPCMDALPILEINPDCAAWLRRETRRKR
jgi:periplasmic divalent cation tolerance protein